MKIIFRELKKLDREKMVCFWESLSDNALYFFRHYSNVDEIFAEKSHKIITLVDNKIVGYGFLLPNKNFPETPSLGIVVSDDFVNKGIGTLLMQELENLGIEKNYKSIYLTTFISNARAVNLFEKSGFEIIEVIKRYGIPAYGMKKNLTQEKERVMNNE